MRPRVRWSLTWGLVGGLTVLVGGFGARLAEASSLTLPIIGAVALVVTVVTTGLAFVLAPYIF